VVLLVLGLKSKSAKAVQVEPSGIPRRQIVWSDPAVNRWCSSRIRPGLLRPLAARSRSWRLAAIWRESRQPAQVAHLGRWSCVW